MLYYKRIIATIIDYIILILGFGSFFFLIDKSQILLFNITFMCFVVFPIYQISLYSKGLTFGKKIIGLVVVKNNLKEELTIPKMLLRETILKFLSLLFLSIGRQPEIFLHDKLMNTKVICGPSPKLRKREDKRSKSGGSSSQAAAFQRKPEHSGV